MSLSIIQHKLMFYQIITTDEHLQKNRGCCFLVQGMLPGGFPFHQFIIVQACGFSSNSTSSFKLPDLCNATSTGHTKAVH